MTETKPELPSERVALVTWHLVHGEALTCGQAAQLTGLTRRSVRELLERIGRVLPVQFDGETWFLQ